MIENYNNANYLERMLLYPEHTFFNIRFIPGSRFICITIHKLFLYGRFREQMILKIIYTVFYCIEKVGKVPVDVLLLTYVFTCLRIVSLIYQLIVGIDDICFFQIIILEKYHLVNPVRIMGCNIA